MRGRFAPSPSGEMHLGNAWTALLAWLQVRSKGGTMVLRIEDLDPDRSKEKYADQLMKDMAWLGLDWDEGPDKGGSYGPYRQAERRNLYAQALEKLQEFDLIYPCYCTRAEIREAALAPNGLEKGLEYPGTCRELGFVEQTLREQAGRSPALRVRVPNRDIAFFDLCRGKVSQNLSRVGDFVVRRSDGVHAYQLAVVVDDGLMEITHVLRGEDLLLSTPRQIWLYEMLGLPVPRFAHVPLLYGSDGNRLSKRHGALSVAALRARGVGSEQIIGFLAHLAGFIPAGEPAKPRELLNYFSLNKLPEASIIVQDELLILKA